MVTGNEFTKDIAYYYYYHNLLNRISLAGICVLAKKG